MNEDVNESQQKEMTALEKCINIFISPKETAESINRKSDIILPLVLIAIMAIIFNLVSVHLQVTQPAVQLRMEKCQKQIMKKFGLNEKQIDEALEKQQQNPMKNPILQYGGSVISAIFGNAFFILLMVVILWVLGNWILAYKAPFEKMFAISAYAMLIRYVGSMMALPLIMNQKSIKAGFHLGNMLDENTSTAFVPTFLQAISLYINLFEIWTLIVLAIGMAVIYKTTTSKAIVIPFMVWGVFVLIFAAGVAALSSLSGINLMSCY
ncbi:YIP1 family protein [candidate division KSB1 bacterium]|nr:YIP1 family protein [candidate division KSB1 bacterium]